MSVIEAVSAAISPTFEGTGIYLEEVTLTGGSPKILTVIIDSETHLNLDQVTSVTRRSLKSWRTFQSWAKLHLPLKFPLLELNDHLPNPGIGERIMGV